MWRQVGIIARRGIRTRRPRIGDEASLQGWNDDWELDFDDKEPQHQEGKMHRSEHALLPRSERAMIRAAKTVPKGVDLEDWVSEAGRREESRTKSEPRINDDPRKQHYRQLLFDHVPVSERVVLLFPGYGSQHVGMGEKSSGCPASAQLFEEASALLGENVLALCRNGPRSLLDQLTRSEIAIFVSSVATFERLRAEQKDLNERLTDVLGFSVGEFAALVASGVFTFPEALRLVKARAEAMQECAQLTSSGQLTVRVFAASLLDEAMEEARRHATEKEGGIYSGVCEVAAWLCCGVKVVGGSELCLRFLEEHADHFRFRPVKRAPLVPALHTSLMENASKRVHALLHVPSPQHKPLQRSKDLSDVKFKRQLQQYVTNENVDPDSTESTNEHSLLSPQTSSNSVESDAVAKSVAHAIFPRVPRCNVYSCRSGKVHGLSPGRIARNIADQISSPVHWEQCMQALMSPYFCRNLQRARKELDEEFPTLYEVGPNRMLGKLLQQTSKKAHRQSYVHIPS